MTLPLRVIWAGSVMHVIAGCLPAPPSSTCIAISGTISGTLSGIGAVGGGAVGGGAVGGGAVGGGVGVDVEGGAHVVRLHTGY